MTSTALEAATAALVLNGKYHRNANKLAFMSMTNAGRFAFETYGAQLEQMRIEAAAATEAWTAIAANLNTQEIVSIMTEAAQVKAAA